VRRRLVLAIVGTVVATLALAGLGTLALARIDARRATESDLRPQASAIAAAVRAVGATAFGPGGPPGRPGGLGELGRVLAGQGVGLAVVTAGGDVVPLTALPAGLAADDLDGPTLLAGGAVSGSRGRTVWAAAGAPAPRVAFVAVVAREADAVIGTALRWFLVAAVVTVAVGALVALRLGRRLVEPLRRADEATRRVAAGDLAVRLPDPPPGDGDELAQLTRSVNAMAAALQRSQGLEREFLLSVSHDLRTPLTSIRGWAEAVADGAAPDPKAAGGVILAESRRLERLVADLLDLARLEARTFSLHAVPVDASAVAAATAEGLRPRLAEAGLALTVDAPAPVRVAADPDRLGQVVANLVENALKHAASSVRVSVGPEAGGGVVAVDDDGPGIAAEDLPHVFERLYVARSAPRGREVGSGLGLAIVRELVGAMGGGVRADRGPAGGARLAVWLPAAGPSADER
jgi:two-component system sensor histidine kinase BaeS